MVTDNKPTKEELKAKEDEAIKAAEELKDKQQIPQDEEEAEVVVEPDEERKEEKKPQEPEEEQAEPSKEKFKKEASASARENQRILAKNRVINQALVEADELPEPTEQDLQKEYPDWELMTDVEKSLAKETVVSRNWRKKIAEGKNQATKIEKWNESVDTFIDDPKNLVDNPDLEGKTEEFREFATLPENNSTSFPTLVGAFLYKKSQEKVEHKGGMFLRGKGGANEKPDLKDGKISLEEARKIRETDYNKWKELNAAGKIDYNL